MEEVTRTDADVTTATATVTVTVDDDRVEPERRVSFYVEAIDDMIECVLKHEQFLFSDRELQALNRFKHLDCKLDQIGYENDITDLERACRDLWHVVEFSSPSSPRDERDRDDGRRRPAVSSGSKKEEEEEQSNVIDLTLSSSSEGEEEEGDSQLGPEEGESKPFNKTIKRRNRQGGGMDERFQDQAGEDEDDEDGDETTMDLSRLAEDRHVLENEDAHVVLSLLSMEELVALGKRMKVTMPTGKTTRGEWTKALLRTSNQSTLSFFRTPTCPIAGTTTTTTTTMTKTKTADVTKLAFGVGYDAKGNKLTQSSVVARQALERIGPVIRISQGWITLFTRLSLVFHRTSYSATSSQPNKTSAFTSSLLARFGKRRYPDYVVSRTFSIFPSRGALTRFERALEIEKVIEESLEGGVWGGGGGASNDSTMTMTKSDSNKNKVGGGGGGGGGDNKGKKHKESLEDKLERYRQGTRVWERVEREWHARCRTAQIEEDNVSAAASSSTDRHRPGRREAQECEEESPNISDKEVRIGGGGSGEGNPDEKEEEEERAQEEDDDDKRRRLYYRRRFDPGWPLCRAGYKAAACYAKLTLYRRGKRGDWYDRLALVLMKYPLGEERQVLVELGQQQQQQEGRDPKLEHDEDDIEDQKKKKKIGTSGVEKKKRKKEKLSRERRLEALRVCQQGLEDPFTHLIYKSSLERRIARIESSLEVAKPVRRDRTVVLEKARARQIEGERLDDPTLGKKSVWRARDGREVSVEELALEQYINEGWKGFHSENGVLTSIFALVFWDIIFAPIDGVFETPYQSAPLDLATDAFAIVRRPLIDARLEAIRNGQAVELLKTTDDRERPLNTWAVGIRWDRYSQQDLIEIVNCIGGRALALILTVFVEEYGHRTGGIPDLCLWNPDSSKVLFSEVKGPGDSLSETQKVWIDVLVSSGVKVDVCRVVESRTIRLDHVDDDDDEEEEEEDEEDDEEEGKQKKKKRKKTPQLGQRKKKQSRGQGRSRSTSSSAAGGRGGPVKKRAKTEEIDLSDSD
ncbi:hypothetical protein JCM3766R1_005419 [Sporobolomyces carnicolor]